jgi:hypothetical protein
VPHDAAAPLSRGRAPSPPPIHLLQDGSLTLRVHPSLAHAAAPWIPLPPSAPPPHPSPSLPSPPAARIRAVPVRAARDGVPAAEPTLEMLRVRAWLDAETGRVRLAGPEGGVRGTVDLARGRATVGVPGAAPFAVEEQNDVACALTVAAALLLGRAGGALLHAGAVVAPDGRAWLLAGDSHSGKSTACANLIRAGWDWLADDQVVVRGDPAGGVRVEGWPRPFSLDEGFAAGRPLGRRAPLDPGGLGPGRRRAGAPLGGVLLPRVEAGGATRLEPAHPAETLGALIRQSPWLLADRHAAPAVLALLSTIARAPGFRLFAGLDSYADPPLLRRRVAAAVCLP